MVRQDAAVQHVGIGQHDVGALADGAAGILRRVAIVGERADLGAHRVHRRLEFVQLILGQRLGGKQVKGAGVGIFNQALENRQVVAKRLAAGSRSDHHDVLAFQAQLERLRLVRIQARDAASDQSMAQMHGRADSGIVRILALARRLMADGADGRIRIRHPLAEARNRSLDAATAPRQAEEVRRLWKAEGQVHWFRLFFASLRQREAKVQNKCAAKCHRSPALAFTRDLTCRAPSVWPRPSRLPAYRTSACRRLAWAYPARTSHGNRFRKPRSRPDCRRP